jgi:hypothetical protein
MSGNGRIIGVGCQGKRLWPILSDYLMLQKRNGRFSVDVVDPAPLKKCYTFIKVFRYAKCFMTQIVNLLPHYMNHISYVRNCKHDDYTRFYDRLKVLGSELVEINR